MLRIGPDLEKQSERALTLARAAREASPEQARKLGELAASMPIALLGIVVILIWQFNSFRRPSIIFITIPLAFPILAIGILYDYLTLNEQLSEQNSDY